MYVTVPVLIKMQYERMRHALLFMLRRVEKAGMPYYGIG